MEGDITMSFWSSEVMRGCESQADLLGAVGAVIVASLNWIRWIRFLVECLDKDMEA